MIIIKGGEKKIDMSKKKVDYRILIKTDKQFFKIGHVTIELFKGDFYYTPSQQKIIDDLNNCRGEMIDHIAWHENGRTHTKMIDKKYFNVESRQKIKSIGYQDIVIEKVKNYKKLPIRDMKKSDVVLDTYQYVGPIEFQLSIVSGKLINKYYNKQETTKIKPINIYDDDIFLSRQIKCLGYKSGNADKLLQFVLKKCCSQFSSERQLFIPGDSEITNITE